MPGSHHNEAGRGNEAVHWLRLEDDEAQWRQVAAVERAPNQAAVLSAIGLALLMRVLSSWRA